MQIDVVGATVGLVLALPLSILIAVAIKATSRGPILFRQPRAGFGGCLFDVLKFRTMADGTHAAVLNDPVARQQYESNDYKLPPNDHRITSVGRFLRKTSLDEVPQLVNVLRGEMSLVGVRPLLKPELERRSAEDQALYRAHLPGLTGLWQVGGRSTVGDHDRLHLDREYLQTWSVRSNLAILARTPVAVLRGAGAH